MRTGATFLHELRVGPPERIRWVRVHATPSAPAPDGAVSWAGVLLDVTELREAEAERRRLEEQAARGERLAQLGLMAGGIAHDFNNLLVGVFGAAAALREELLDGHPARPLAAQIERAAREMGELTRQMLDFSGRSPAPVRRVELGRAVRDSLALVEASLGGAARLELALSPAPTWVEIDPGQVTQLVANLVLNASQAMGPRGGTVRVETGAGEVGGDDLRDGAFGAVLAPGRYAWLVVRDDGPGMSEAVRERIFEPFFSSKGSNRGLGLAVVAGIVRGRGGSVRVSSAPARGATFRILLPLAAAPDDGATAAPEAGRPPAGTTVLVVDDEPHVRAVARRVLERCGYRVLLAEHGEEALAIAAGAEISVALVDATMPGLSGAETLRRLRALRPALPLVLTSGHAEDEVRQAATDAGAGFLPKPFAPDDLRGAIERGLLTGKPGRGGPGSAPAIG
jgi:signal transduction histidine kinase